MAFIKNKLIIGIASRALFNLDDSHHIYEKEGLEAYAEYQMTHENDPLLPGVAFHLVKKLLLLNKKQQKNLIEVILLSRNTAETGLRIFNSIKHYELTITCAAFAGGNSPHIYIPAFGCDLFLSAHSEDVQRTLAAGFASALILPSLTALPLAYSNDEVRIAFDGDSVIFSDESEKIYQEKGLAAFAENEEKAANIPLRGGPFKAFLSALHNLQKTFKKEEVCPIRTALITARSAPAHERVIKTLRTWDIRIDESLFLGGSAKGEFLKAFGADFFFDDQRMHCESAKQHVATGHVPHGIMN